MKRHVHEEIELLKNKLLFMGSIAEEMLRLSAKVFLERKEGISETIFQKEEEVNKLQMEIDEMGVKILALYQPEATDLRTILSSIKINAELERIADQAVNVTQTATYHLLKEVPVQSLMEIPKIATMAQEMIKESLDAFTKSDLTLAQNILKKDQEVDLLKSKTLNEMISTISHNPQQAKQFVDLILIAKNLEKIADHATNIAEDVIFMVAGKDIRHHAQQPS